MLSVGKMSKDGLLVSLPYMGNKIFHDLPSTTRNSFSLGFISQLRDSRFLMAAKSGSTLNAPTVGSQIQHTVILLIYTSSLKGQLSIVSRCCEVRTLVENVRLCIAGDISYDY